ncbi:RNA polymerase sigma factor region1.1 domain-containing protein [Methylobacterium oxalidis]|uniref:RNA polymerase sigma factor 70 region 1.1 domain-containing protein n=1 Tax=Methylobacterium oxalidis TaxID=944322 RepID=A0A512J9W4_9HYPH|nr:RNA polymerase sigma factor region1.1 domain-containing protein [Methylobacterium oxalidis]GEP06669.1 hypothetical protein MOX02_47070 [Methylobacterium oxalidis]GJE30116.1 hypothetical protein LDDCCGHA_0279 [Methylobacterium oxalidis]GLS63310.1 hypothetical protein GCM10007888_16910 [Methylobacterium oxalidis]
MGKRDDAQARRQAIIDGMLADALRPAYTYRLPSHHALPADIRHAVDRLLAKAEAERTRCLTYDDLEEALPPRDVTPEDLEAIFWILAEHGIEVEDGEAG